MADPTGATAGTQYVPAFRANLNLLPQQTRPRLITAIDSDLAYDVTGDKFNADDIGTSDPVDVTVRVPRTPNHFVDQVRRIAFFAPFHDAPWIDDEDKVRELEDPTSKVMMAVMAGQARKRDSKVVQAALGTYNYQDNNGNIQAGEANANFIAAASADAHEAENIAAVQKPSGAYGLTLGKLIDAKTFLDASELDEMDPGDKPSDYYYACTANQLNDLLRSIPAGNSMYNDARSLVAGTISYFMGFNFIRMGSTARGNLLPKTGYTRQTIAFHKRAIMYKSRTIKNVRVDQRADFSYRWQAYYETDHGALRHYDEGVMRVDCDENTQTPYN